MRAAQGKLFSPDGCGHRARGAAAPPPGCTTAKGRKGPPAFPERRSWPTRHRRRTVLPARTRTRTTPVPRRRNQCERGCRKVRRTVGGAAWKRHSKAGQRVDESSLRDVRMSAVSLGGGRHAHNPVQQATASRGVAAAPRPPLGGRTGRLASQGTCASPRRRLAEGGDGAILLWAAQPDGCANESAPPASGKEAGSGGRRCRPCGYSRSRR